MFGCATELDQCNTIDGCDHEVANTIVMAGPGVANYSLDKLLTAVN